MTTPTAPVVELQAAIEIVKEWRHYASGWTVTPNERGQKLTPNANAPGLLQAAIDKVLAALSQSSEAQRAVEAIEILQQKVFASPICGKNTESRVSIEIDTDGDEFNFLWSDGEDWHTGSGKSVIEAILASQLPRPT